MEMSALCRTAVKSGAAKPTAVPDPLARNPLVRNPLARSLGAGILVAVMGVAALTACSATAGQSPVTKQQPPTFTGISASAPDHSVAVRDLYVPDPGPAGYPAGAPVPVTVQVWNNTNTTVSLTGAAVTSGAMTGGAVTGGAVTGGAVAGGAVASLIDGKATASGPVATFSLPIAGGASITLNQQSGRFLQIQCAARALTAGTDIPMTFAFSNGATITADVPIGRFPDSSASVSAVATC